MENIRELVASALAKVAKGLKLSPTDLERIQAWKEGLEQSKLDHNDRVERLKVELRQVEGRIRKLGEEYDREDGAVKKVAAKQLELACQELELKDAKMEVLFANLEKVMAAQAKIDQLEEAMRRGVTEDQADLLAVELEEAFDALERSDEAMNSAEQVKYQRPAREPVEVSERARALRSAPASISPRAAKVLGDLRKQDPAAE